MAEYICPHCKGPIYDDETLECIYCGESLNRGTGFLGNLKYPTPRVIIVISVIVILIAFLILVIR